MLEVDDRATTWAGAVVVVLFVFPFGPVVLPEWDTAAAVDDVALTEWA